MGQSLKPQDFPFGMATVRQVNNRGFYKDVVEFIPIAEGKLVSYRPKGMSGLVSRSSDD